MYSNLEVMADVTLYIKYWYCPSNQPKQYEKLNISPS